ncbi:MAG: diguanylate cyclase [Acidobacteria bacterium]|nr:diguanylate cyclase [Acidobacteriota bacterium]
MVTTIPAADIPWTPVRKISVEDGLSHNVVYAVQQDVHGFIWLGTEGGLDRFDGYEFKPFSYARNQIGLPGHDIACIVQDCRSDLWIGHWGGGLVHISLATGQANHHRKSSGEALALCDDRVQCVFEDAGGRMWIGTYQGLTRWDTEKKTIAHFLHFTGDPGSLSHDRIWAITQDKQGDIWIATENGLNLLENGEGDFLHFFHDPAVPGSLPHDRVRALFLDNRGELWVGTQDGLARFHRKTRSFEVFVSQADDPHSLSDNTINVIQEDHAGFLWIGTQRGGLNRFDPRTGRCRRLPILSADRYDESHLDIRSILEDRSQILWVASRGEGVFLLDLKPRKFNHLTSSPAEGQGLAHNVVLSVFEDRTGTLWVGSDFGLTRLRQAADHVTYYTHIPGDPSSLANNSVEAIFEDSQGTLWLGTSGGLDRFSPQTSSFNHFRHQPNDPSCLSSDKIQCIIEDSLGQFWIGTRDGLNRMDRASGRCIHYCFSAEDPASLSDNFIRVLHLDDNGQLWVGTDVAGVNRYDPVTDGFVRYIQDPADANSLSSNRITTIAHDRSGNIWIGTVFGLNRLEPSTGRITRYFREDGLPSSTIYGVLVDERNTLWISSNRGLFTFSPATGDIRTYSVSDGLQGQIFKRGVCHRGMNGRMYFGGLEGLNMFDPFTVKDNPLLPPIVLAAFGVTNQEYDAPVPVYEMRQIDLTYEQNDFFFEFAALDYTSPENNQYAYKLEGFDKDWIYSGSRRYASYTNVDHGTYVFRVKATNSDSVWNEDGINVLLTIEAPFWKTWWFRALLTLLGLGLVYLAYQTRMRGLRRRERELRDLVDERTVQLEEANQRLQKLADSDGLTGIANHRYFYEALHLEWRRALRTNEPLSLAMADIDCFKVYNDTFGHQAGDNCLKRVADTLSGIPQRTGDLVARYGGEEFAVLLASADANGARQVAETLRQKIEGLGIDHPDSFISDFVTISIGVASVLPNAAISPSDLVRAADEALYQAKQSGRNRVVCASLEREG